MATKKDTGDDHALQRFIEAQQHTYQVALAELQQGRKRGHWMWFVFPQLKGLGSSPMAERYGMTGIEEARAYLAHSVLGPRVLGCVDALLSHRDASAADLLGEVDALKLRSSLTLFAAADPSIDAFRTALDTFYAGSPDPRTQTMLDALR